MHLAGKCVKFCDQCGLDLPMSIPDPKCKDNYIEPGCKVMCERYWGFKTPATCCPNNFAKSGTASSALAPPATGPGLKPWNDKFRFCRNPRSIWSLCICV